MRLDVAILVVHLFATVYMCGLIWFVQVVHYPMSRRVGEASFCEYSREHQRRTGWVVGPPMVLEFATAALLAWRAPSGSMAVLAIIGLALVGVVWASTAALQVPAHRRLVRCFDDHVIKQLVTTNWIRTAAWSLRSALAIMMLLAWPTG